MQKSCDVLVIGAGMGGLCAAALLSHAGYRTLVAERLPRIGGRCSTIEYKGFKCAAGAIGPEMGGQLLGHLLRCAGELELGFHAEHDLARLRGGELHVNAFLQAAFEQAQCIFRTRGSGHRQSYDLGFHASLMAISASTSLSVACDRREIRFSRKIR